MKKVFAIVAAALISLSLAAQNVQEGSTMVGSLTVPAFTISIQKDAKMVQNAMNQRLKDAKLKTKNTEGYLAALEQVIEGISATPISLYTKVEEQGKKKDRITVVTVCAISSDLTIDQNVLKANVRSWLEGFIPYIDRFEALQQLEIQQENLKKAEKIQKNAASDVASLEKDIANDQKKITDKKKDIEDYKAKIKKCEQDIKDLESSIDKNTKKKAEAEKRLQEADKGVQEAQAEVDKYRSMSE